MQTEIPIPQAELTNVSDLKTDGKNPNRMTKEQHDRLATSIKKYGFIVPIITNKDLLIADGEQRWTVAKSLGMAEVSVIRLPVEEVDRRLLRQVLNKLRGEHELLLDAEEFDAIIADGGKDDLKYLLDLTDGKLERYLNELHPPKDEDFKIPAIDSIITDIKKGDIFKLGKHTLMCGDSTSNEDVFALTNGKVNFVLTDPPYNVEMDGYKDDLTKTEYYAFSNKWFKLAKQISEVILFTPGCGHNLNNLQMWFSIQKPFWLCIWTKTNSMIHSSIGGFQAWEPLLLYGKPKKKIGQDVYNYPITVQQDVADENGNKYHPTPKQVKLWSNLIQDFTDPEHTVMDFFGGSGTTIMACEQTGRIAYSMELDERFCQVIINRWEAYTGGKAERIRQAVSTPEQNNINNN